LKFPARRAAALVAASGLLLVGSALAGPTSSVLAHAELSASIPGLGAVVETPPTELRLTFSEPFEPSFSSLDLLDPTGQTVVADAGDPDPADPYTLVAPLPELGDGIYTVTWQALSTADGHTTSGTFTFGVGDVAPPTGNADLGGGSLHEGHGAGLIILETESRAVSYLGFLLAFGLPIIGWLVVRRTTSSRAIVAALAASIVGSAGLLLVSATFGGADPLAYATTGRTGQLLTARIVIAVAGAVLVWVIGRAGQARAAAVVGCAAGFAGFIAIGLGGHASAYDSAAPLVAIVVHLSAAAIWLSGVVTLAWLAISRSDEPVPFDELVPRFSAIALVAIGIVALTGIYADWIHTRNPLDFSTSYSVALLAKIVIAAFALAFGALNYVDGGRDRPRLGGFRRRVGIEALLAVAVVVATGNLTSGSPPAQSMPSELARAVSSATALGPGTSLAMEPGRPGPTRFIATLDPTDAYATVDLALERLDRTSEPTRYPMRQVEGDGPPRYLVDGTLIEPDSTWSASIITVNEAGVEIARSRYQFEMDASEIVAGLATPAIDPALIVATLLIAFAIILAVFALAGYALPRTDLRTSRIASLTGSVAGAALGAIILFGGQV
jgi:copper transport protein